MPSTEEVFEKVKNVLADALAADEDDVTMDATLVDNLGAESIDLLDIVFQLEKEFGIKIDSKELIPTEMLNDPAYVQEGKLTETGLAELRKALPSADLEAFSKNPMIQNLAKILTVRDLVKIVESKLNA